MENAAPPVGLEPTTIVALSSALGFGGLSLRVLGVIGGLYDTHLFKIYSLNSL